MGGFLFILVCQSKNINHTLAYTLTHSSAIPGTKQPIITGITRGRPWRGYYILEDTEQDTRTGHCVMGTRLNWTLALEPWIQKVELQWMNTIIFSQQREEIQSKVLLDWLERGSYTKKKKRYKRPSSLKENILKGDPPNVRLNWLDSCFNPCPFQFSH